MRLVLGTIAICVMLCSFASAQDASWRLGNAARTALMLGQFPIFLAEAREDFEDCRRTAPDAAECIGILVQISKEALSAGDVAALDFAVTQAAPLAARLPPLDERRAHVSYYSGHAAYQRGDYSKAKSDIHQAIAVFEQIPNPNFAHLAMFYRDLGNVYYELREYPAARANLEKSISIFRSYAPEDRSILTYSYQSLARTIIRMNGAKEAEIQLLALRNTLDITRGDRLLLATVFGTLATALDAQGRVFEAANYAVLRLAYLEGASNPNQLQIAHAKVSLASLHVRLGQPRFLDLADANLASALKVYEQNFRPEHPWVLAALNTRARILFARGRIVEAENVLRDILARQRTIAGRDHEDSIVAAWALANLFMAQNTKYAEARLLFCEANLGALERIRAYRDFGMAAQADLRKYRPSFLGQVRTIWQLSEPRKALAHSSASCFNGTGR